MDIREFLQKFWGGGGGGGGRNPRRPSLYETLPVHCSERDELDFILPDGLKITFYLVIYLSS